MSRYVSHPRHWLITASVVAAVIAATEFIAR